MLTVLLVRHAEAADRDLAAAAGIPDEHRALTPRGRKRMARIAPALAALVPDVVLVATSPLLRAAQTAALLATEFRDAELRQTDALAPGAGPEAVAQFLVSHGRSRSCALVGHEPDLGLFASWALSGAMRSFVPLKKSGAALLRFPDDIATGGGAELDWLLTPAQLRRLKGK